MNGPNTTKNTRTGRDTARATRSARGSVYDFGMISPITTCRIEITTNARTDRDRRGDTGRHVAEELLEQSRDRRLADGAESQRADRDPELHRGDEVRWVGDDLAHDARALVALPDQLVQPRVTHRDERVLRGHEERVPQDYDDDRAELERGGDAHASLQALSRRRL